MSSNFIVFPFRAVSGLFCSSLERQRTKQAGTEQRAERRPEEDGRREWRRGACQTGFIVWRDTGASSPSDRPSRGRAASTPEEAGVVKSCAAYFSCFLDRLFGLAATNL